MLQKAIGFAVVVLAAGLLAGCNQNQQQQKAAPQEMARGGHHGIRAACADDIQKYCANEQRKKRCLKDNMDKLSAACKSAVEESHGGRKRDNGGDD